jgi:hypothetical protein
MENLLQVVWDRIPRLLLRKQEMLVLGACTATGPLTLDVRAGFHERNTDLMVKPGGMTSQLHVLVNKPCKDNLKQLYSEYPSGEQYILTPLGQ